MSFRLAIMTTTWKRPELTAAVLRWWDEIRRKGVDLHWVAVGDHMAHGNQGSSYPADNNPLGAKHNLGLSVCRHRKPDAVMVIGSDDIVEPELVRLSCEAIRAGAMWTQPRDLYFYHPETGRAAKPSQTQLTGAGRVYSVRLLDMLDWRLWPDDATSKLDGKAEQTIRDEMRARKVAWGDVDDGPLGVWGCKVIPRAVLDIKTDVNMWDFDEAVAITSASEIELDLARFEYERLKYHDLISRP